MSDTQEIAALRADIDSMVTDRQRMQTEADEYRRCLAARDARMKAMQARLDGEGEEIADRDAKIERLKEDYITLANDNVTFYQGLERAAKISENFTADPFGDMIAAAILAYKASLSSDSAEIKREGSNDPMPNAT